MKLFNDELCEAILDAYKENIKDMVKTTLAKGSVWGPRELEWFITKMSTATRNTEALLDTLYLKQSQLDEAELDNTEVNTDEHNEKAEPEGD